VYQHFCSDILWRKQAERWRTGGWIHHHDSVPAHSALSVQEFLFWPKIARVLLHTLLAPQIWHLVTSVPLSPELKLELKGRRFDGIIRIQKQSHVTFAEFKTQDFRKYVQQWRESWARCANSQDDNME